MASGEAPLHEVSINFNGTKRYPSFPFPPRKGDRINVTDDGTMFAMDVEGIWFDDNYGVETCEVQLNCQVVEETSVGEGYERR